MGVCILSSGPPRSRHQDQIRLQETEGNACERKWGGSQRRLRSVRPMRREEGKKEGMMQRALNWQKLFRKILQNQCRILKSKQQSEESSVSQEWASHCVLSLAGNRPREAWSWSKCSVVFRTLQLGASANSDLHSRVSERHILMVTTSSPQGFGEQLLWGSQGPLFLRKSQFCRMNYSPHDCC